VEGICPYDSTPAGKRNGPILRCATRKSGPVGWPRVAALRVAAGLTSVLLGVAGYWVPCTLLSALRITHFVRMALRHKAPLPTCLRGEGEFIARSV
jgi:hypothetical protein